MSSNALTLHLFQITDRLFAVADVPGQRGASALGKDYSRDYSTAYHNYSG